MALRSVFTLDSFLFFGSVGTCFLSRTNPSLTSFTRFLSRAFRLATTAGSFCFAVLTALRLLVWVITGDRIGNLVDEWTPSGLSSPIGKRMAVAVGIVNAELFSISFMLIVICSTVKTPILNCCLIYGLVASCIDFYIYRW